MKPPDDVVPAPGTNRFNQENFEWIAKAPNSWYAQAQLLKHSADALKQKFDEVIRSEPHDPMLPWSYANSFMFLAGLSLENAIKGILLRSPDNVAKVVISGNKIDFRKLNTKNGHQIKRFFEMAGMKLDRSELTFIDKAQSYVQWAGRYALPTRAREFQDSTGLKVNISNDVMIFEQLYERLVSMYWV